MKFLLHGRLFFGAFFSFSYVTAMNQENLPMMPFYQSISYNYFPTIFKFKQIPIDEIKQSLVCGRLKFYYAVRHKAWPKCFSIIEPHVFKCSDERADEVRTLIFNAINERRLFRAIRLDLNFIFITTFHIEEELCRLLFYDGRKAF